MSDFEKVYMGLSILREHGGGSVRCLHDEILICVDTPTESMDAQRLNELGWSWDRRERCWRRFT